MNPNEKEIDVNSLDILHTTYTLVYTSFNFPIPFMFRTPNRMFNVPCEIRDTQDLVRYESTIFSRITLEFLQINCIRFCFQVIPFAICIFGLMHHFFVHSVLFFHVLVSLHKNNRRTNDTERERQKIVVERIALISYVSLYANDLAQSLANVKMKNRKKNIEQIKMKRT